MENILVSIIMPVYNGSKYIEEAINSILNQSYKKIELIIVDDGSTDDTLSVIENINDDRIRIFRNIKNMGLPYSRNKGLDMASGEYIALLDADDIAFTNRIEKQLKYMIKYNLDVCGSECKILSTGKHIRKPKNYEYIKYYLMFFNCITNSSAMVKKEFLNKYNIKYNEKYFVCQDYDFWVKCSLKGKISNYKKPLVFYRDGHDNITKKSINQKMFARKCILDEIHTFAFKQNGFDLKEDEILLINKLTMNPILDDIS
ncbi:glycosyltransferase family 2 protein, partial [Clostridium perfringens]